MEEHRVSGDPTVDRIRAATVGEVEHRPVVLADPDPSWPTQAAERMAAIRDALGGPVLALHHAGSTSVPNLPAKPVLDLVLVVADPADEAPYVPALEGLGYELRIREPDWYEHRVLRTVGELSVNLHVFGPGCVEVERMLALRDHLRADASDRERYAVVKRELAARDWPTVQHYADAKSEVVADILTRAGVAGRRTGQSVQPRRSSTVGGGGW
jgi:GrpB-like predicted nucleotidyltransferase (UPF0157 family)